MSGVGDQGRVEAVYRSVHPRLWRSLLAYTGDAELASDAEAEAFAQALGRGEAVDDVAAWVWRSAFHIASGLLAARSRPNDLRPAEGSTPPTGSVAEFLGLLADLSPQQRACVALRYVGGYTAPGDRRAARDQCGHRAGAAASGPRRAARHDHGGRACVTTSTLWWRTDSRFSTTCPSRTRGRAFSTACPSGTRGRAFRSPTTTTMIDLETPVPTEPRRKGPVRVLVAGLLAAAAVVAIVLVVTRDGDDGTPADEPSPTVTVPRRLRERCSGQQDEQLVPGTYFVDEVDGTPTPRIFVTIGAGWSNFIDGRASTSLGGSGPTS